MVDFLLLEAHELQQVIEGDLGDPWAVEVEGVFVQWKQRALFEEVEVFEEGSKVDDDAWLEGWEIYLGEVQQLGYLYLIVSRSIALEDMSLKRRD